MPVVNNTTQLYPIRFLGGVVPIEEGLGHGNVTVNPTSSYNTVTRTVTLNLSDGRTVNYYDIDVLSWLQVKFLAGI